MHEAGSRHEARRCTLASTSQPSLTPTSQPSHHAFLASLPLISREIKVLRRIRAYDQGIEKHKRKSIATSQQHHTTTQEEDTTTQAQEEPLPNHKSTLKHNNSTSIKQSRIKERRRRMRHGGRFVAAVHARHSLATVLARHSLASDGTRS